MNENCSCEQCQLKTLFFSHVGSDIFEKMCSSKSEQEFEKGEVIAFEGTPIKEFTYLKSGLIKLSKSWQGNRDQIISLAMPYDFVSLLSVFSSPIYNYTVTAIEKTTICSIEMDLLRSVALDNGHLAMDLMTRVSEATDRIILNYLEIRRKNLKGRVAFVLLYFANHIYKSDRYELPISRREIAEFIGMTTENVIRAMSEFRKDHIVRFDGKEIEILNKKLLESISEHG